jgi:hypothetical protein
MKIYVEHEGNFYDFSDRAFERIADSVTIINNLKFELAVDSLTDKRDFEIGARVYFDNVGWTEVINGHATLCAFFARAPGVGCSSLCTSPAPCPLGGVFKKLETPEQKGSFFDIMPAPEQKGIKHDSGKIRPGLIPVECIKAVAEVLTFGADKYSPNGWKDVSPERYEDALWRHYIAWKTGEKNDEESRLSHAAHFATNAIFLLWFELEKLKTEAGE